MKGPQQESSKINDGTAPLIAQSPELGTKTDVPIVPAMRESFPPESLAESLSANSLAQCAY